MSVFEERIDISVGMRIGRTLLDCHGYRVPFFRVQFLSLSLSLFLSLVSLSVSARLKLVQVESVQPVNFSLHLMLQNRLYLDIL